MAIRLREKPKVTVNWLIQIRDAKTLKLIKEIRKHNVLTNGALALFAAELANPLYNTHVVNTCPSRRSWTLRLGTGAGVPAAADTDLFTPVAASYKTGSVSSTGPATTYYVRYLPEDANGYTYTEAGLFEYNSATMINHLMLSPTLPKDATILVDFYITVTFS